MSFWLYTLSYSVTIVFKCQRQENITKRLERPFSLFSLFSDLFSSFFDVVPTLSICNVTIARQILMEITTRQLGGRLLHSVMPLGVGDWKKRLRDDALTLLFVPSITGTISCYMFYQRVEIMLGLHMNVGIHSCPIDIRVRDDIRLSYSFSDSSISPKSITLLKMNILDPSFGSTFGQ